MNNSILRTNWPKAHIDILKDEVKEMRIAQLKNPVYRQLNSVRNLNNDLLAKCVTKKTKLETSVVQIYNTVRKHRMYRKQEVENWRPELIAEADSRTIAGQTSEYHTLNIFNEKHSEYTPWVDEENALGIATRDVISNSHLTRSEKAKAIQAALGTTYPRTLPMIQVIIMSQFAPEMLPSNHFIFQSKCFRSREEHTSSGDNSTEADDEALMLSIRNAATVDWVEICEAAFPNKTRTGLACRCRWEGYLNPASLTTSITSEERNTIISDFNEYGIHFASFRNTNRSRFVLRTLLYKHVCAKHRADGGAPLFLFKKLHALLAMDCELSLDDWVDKSIENINHSQCYKLIIRNNIQFMYNWFGVSIADSR